MRTVVVFDIDGTLLDSVAAHQSAFLAALDSFAFEAVDTNWPVYPEHMDSAIFHAIMQANLGRRATEEEMTRLDDDLVTGFQERWDVAADPMRASSMELLRWLRQRLNTTVVFATGGLAGVTAPKLRGLGEEGAPVSSASTSETRVELVRDAISLAGGDLDRDRIISVGDGIWDGRAAWSLGAEFVGVGSHGLDAFALEHPATIYVETVADLVEHPMWESEATVVRS